MLKKDNPEKITGRVFFAAAIFLFSISVFADPTSVVTDSATETNTSNILNVLQNNVAPAINNTNAAVQAQTNILQESLTGISGMGSAFNTQQEKNFRNWTPTAQDLANMVAEGLQTGSLADQIKYYNQKFPIPTMQQLTPNDKNSIAGNYGVFSAVNTNAAFSVADKSFDNAAQIVNQINYLYTLIDRQQTLKQSMDLNNAILAKIASLQNELLRVQAQQLKMQAVDQQQSNSARLLMTHFIKKVK